MIIRDLDFIDIVVSPLEAHAPLMVDPDRVLSGSLSLQLLQPISWRRAKILDRFRVVEHPELPQANLLHIDRELLDELSSTYAFRVAVCEGFDHVGIV